MSSRAKRGQPRKTQAPPDSRRKHRPRPTPRWLKAQQDVDDMARRRTLLVLSVLSGEKPVTDAIVEAGISRGLYYQLEERALRAVLRALTPGVEPTQGEQGAGADGYLKRIGELETRLKGLETQKRRAERLLLLTRKVLPRGPVASGRGRPPKASAGTRTPRLPAPPSSSPSGPVPSPVSPTTTPRPASLAPPAPSTRMAPGARAPSAGSAS